MKNSASGPKKAVSPMPVDLRYFSALMAMLRGSREYGSFVIGSTMLQMSDSVTSDMNGSMVAVLASGITSMSEAWIACQPRIDEPSNPSPSSKMSSESSPSGMVKCCQRPMKSMNFRSTITTFFSAANARTCLGVKFAISFLSPGKNVVGVRRDRLARHVPRGNAPQSEEGPEFRSSRMHDFAADAARMASTRVPGYPIDGFPLPGRRGGERKGFSGRKSGHHHLPDDAPEGTVGPTVGLVPSFTSGSEGFEWHAAPPTGVIHGQRRTYP